MARKLEVAWAAGLFEGEGTACVSGSQRQPIVALVSTDEDVVRRFAQVMGCGSVHSYSRPPNKPFWRWTASGADDVIRALTLLEPYLGQRRTIAAASVRARAEEIIVGRDLCKRGHDLSDPAHLYLHKKTGKRHCRTCRTAYARGWTPRLAS